MRRPLLNLLLTAVLASGFLVAGATPARAETTAVTVAGSLQSELGCPGDWQPDCAATHLSPVEGTTTWQSTFHVPAGEWEFKIAVNDSWDTNYGAGGVAGGANIPLSLVGAADLVFSFDSDTHRIGIQPVNLSGATTPADRKLARNSLRQPLTDERYYFLMADRFANGDTANDTGGLTGGRLDTGFDPTDKGFYHGGDLKGVINELDYIKGLGTTAIWLTPSFTNKPVQGTAGNESAGYHGYWITDFTTIDPHLGTNQDMKNLIKAAHARGMKVFFDIITNHTADVIDYAEKTYTYIPTSDRPYTDADGNVFDPAAVANSPDFPTLDVDSSFPYHPVFDTQADATAKTPAWLNDRTLYHNRGDSTFAGESSEYGDFVGLDDLFTENPKVVDGMIDVYKAWVDLGIDGFRIDTVKHVDIPFWQEFGPAMQAEAKRIGNPDFFMFGEVYDARPSFMSTYSTTAKLPATLDFGFQAQAQAFALGKATTSLRDLYADDDYYTDTDSNAYQMPTFLGNHDMGRIAYLLRAGGISDDTDLMKRVQLADALMYLTRGQPITYYGDEQGFIGAGGDKDARQDMFATQTEQYATEDVLGGSSGSKDRFDTSAPLYRFIRGLAKLRAAHPALADGAQVHRYASSKAGIYAFSRIDSRTGAEYVVALNNATTAKKATFDTFNANARFRALYGARGSLRTGRNARITVTVPALSAVVYKTNSRVDVSHRPLAVAVSAPAPGGVVGGRAEISAELNTDEFAQASFWFRPVGTSAWQALGTDDNAPYRVFHDVSGYPMGTLLEYRVVVKDGAGHVSASASYGIVGTPEASGGDTGTVGPITQPSAVSVPGDLNTAMGCTGDWAPACDQAQLTLDPKDQIWKGSYDLPAATYAYKAAIDKSWDENYGANAVPNGSNISLKLTGDPVTFYYDHRTHWVTSDAEGPIITAPGSWNAALGCGADWAPDCMRPWLEDPDGDGTYTWATSELPAGTYQFKVAHDLGWSESYPAGNVTVDVPADGLVVRVNYDLATHAVSTAVTRPTSEPSLDEVRGTWVSPGLVAWPVDALAVDPSRLGFRLAWGPTGALEVDAEDITGGESAVLSYDPRGLPDAVVAAHPELAGQLALRVDRDTSRRLPGIASGDVAVGVYSGGRLVDAGLVDTSAVG
ncbi:MAG: alpha-amylase [Propionibacteriaceae bacterium]|nr:alpha-amylase [Propionibacteriaceae bacterium]